MTVPGGASGGHPLQVAGGPRRRYVAALGLQLAGLASALGLLAALLLGSPALIVPLGTAVGLSRLLAQGQQQRAWQLVPGPGRPGALPPRAGQLYAAAEGVLLAAAAVLLSPHVPVGAVLAVVLGLVAVVDAVVGYLGHAGRHPRPARAVPPKLFTAFVCWFAAAWLGGLGAVGVAQTVLALAVPLLALAGVVVLLRWTARSVGAWPRPLA